MFSRQVSEALRVLTGIVRLQKGPEDLPYSVPLLVLLILVSSALDAVTWVVVPLPEKATAGVSGPLMIAIGVAVTLLWYGALLRYAGKSARTVQTLTAVFGIQIVLAPALLFSAWFYFTYFQDPTWKLPAGLLRSAVEIWALMILARILRAATQWSMFSCVLLAVGSQLVSALLMASLVSPAPVAP
ncbi:MAG: hypothetical protein U1F39_02820 [Steroidobacteraceae bacterium]